MSSKLKRMYHIIAVLAILHMVAVFGAIGYIFGTGKVTKDQIREMAGVLETDESEEGAEKLADVSGDEKKPRTKVDAGIPGSEREEIARRNIERLMAEADHRLVLAKMAMMEQTRQRESLQKKQEDLLSQSEEEAKERQKLGFKKDVELLSVLKPKVALDHLLTRTPDDAARLIMEMEGRKAKNIEEAAHKDPRKWVKWVEISKRYRDLSPPDAEGEAAE